jgi:ABC-2 type transport system permease protein
MSAWSIVAVIAGATVRSMLGRRRTVLMVVLGLVPVLMALLYRVAGEGSADVNELLDLLIIRTVLPLTALVFGTTALGSELDDGTGVALLTKPIHRWQIVTAKVLSAAVTTILFVAISAAVTTILLGGDDPGSTIAGYVLGIVVGGAAYVAAFVAVSVVTSRALVIGLAYTLLWESWLAGVLPGTKALSIREATLSVVDLFAPRFISREGLETTPALLLLVVVLVGGFVIGVVRLERYQVRGGD